jgi:hypothetical protein
MEISFQLRNGFDLPPRGHVLSKDGHTPLHEAIVTRVKGSRVHPPDTPAHKEPAHSPIARGIRASKWTGQPLECLVCAWPLLLTFQLGTLAAGILSNLKFKKLLGAVSVHNCSLRQPIISQGLSCICTNTLLRFQQGIAGSGLAVSLSIPHRFSWLLKPNAMGAKALEVRIARNREMTTADADEPVPLASTNHMFELAVFYAVWATSLWHPWVLPRPAEGSLHSTTTKSNPGQKAPY